jgi:predicted ArsR family transcriptional regulator
LPADGNRVQCLADALAENGAMASVRAVADGQVLCVRNCTIAQVAWRFPVICDREAAVLKRVLGVEVSMKTCQSRGDAICCFHVQSPAHESTDPPAERSGAPVEHHVAAP